jgi:zinc protease
MHRLIIDTVNLEQERGIVMEERRVSVDNSVPGTMNETLYATAYAAHPYRTPIVGWMRDLETLALADARAYYSAWYAPNNATLVMVGDFSAPRARRLIEKAFGAIPARPLPRIPADPEPTQQGEKRALVHKAAELPALMIGWKADAASAAGHPALRMLAIVLGQGESSRLHRRLVYEQEICTSVAAETGELRDPGLFAVYAQLRPGRSVAEAEEAIAAVVRAVADSGVTAGEAAKARNVLEKEAVDGLVTHAGAAGRIAFFSAVYGSWEAALDPVTRFAGVTPVAIRDAARRVLTDRVKTVVVLVPERQEEVRP